MAVNEPSPRAYPEDKVRLRCHKSLATRAITVIPSEARFYSGSAEIVWLQSIFLRGSKRSFLLLKESWAPPLALTLANTDSYLQENTESL